MEEKGRILFVNYLSYFSEFKKIFLVLAENLSIVAKKLNKRVAIIKSHKNSSN